MKNLLLLAPPAAGKGTQAELLMKRYGSVPISTGDLLRKASRENTEMGHMLQGILQSGKLEDLICIIKTSYLRNDERKKTGKKIGEVDDSYFKLAEKILYNELSISLNMSYEDTKEYVIESVEKIGC